MISLAWKVVRRSVDTFLEHEADVRAGYIAYAVLLAIFPFVIFSVSLTGLIIGEERSTEAVQTLFHLSPDYVAEVLEPVVVEVLSESHSLFTLFILVTVWATMRAVEAVGRAFDRAYGERDGPIWIFRFLKSLLTVVVGAVVFVVLGMSIVFAPVLIHLIENYTNVDLPNNILQLRYGVGVVVFYLFLWCLHYFLPNSHARGYAVWPGALVSTILWVVMATGMSVYLSYAGAYAVTYGALAGIVITLLFLYFSGAIVIYGAELNAAIKDIREEN